MKDRSPGISWGGYLDRETGKVRSEARFGMTRVRDILNILARTDGNAEKAAEILNEDVDSDGFGAISPKEITQVAEFASQHPIEKVFELKR